MESEQTLNAVDIFEGTECFEDSECKKGLKLQKLTIAHWSSFFFFFFFFFVCVNMAYFIRRYCQKQRIQEFKIH